MPRSLIHTCKLVLVLRCPRGRLVAVGGTKERATACVTMIARMRASSRACPWLIHVCVCAPDLQADNSQLPCGDEDEACCVCGSNRDTARMLECDACLRGFHLKCCTPRITKARARGGMNPLARGTLS